MQFEQLHLGEVLMFDEQRFLKACALTDEGKLTEALDEFARIAADTDDPIDKAGVLLYAATTLKVLGEYEEARRQLKAAYILVPSLEESLVEGQHDDRMFQLQVLLEFEEAEIFSFEGQIGTALARFDGLLKKHGRWLQKPKSRETYEMIQSRRGFILADLGRCHEALPILKEAESFAERKAEIYFYLGHCYVSAKDYLQGTEKLAEALGMGLPRNLEFRAHCSLGVAYNVLNRYTQAKAEFEKCAQNADPEYIKRAQLWKRLENVCRQLGLKEQADSYAMRE